MMQRWISALTLTMMLAGVAVAQTPAQNPIDRVVEAGYMSRTTGGDFRESEFLSRAELASILVRSFQLSDRTPPNPNRIQVRDVPSNHWAYSDIQTVLRTGVMTGYRDNLFFPEQRVSRAEAFSIFAQAYGVFQFPEQTIAEVLSQYPDSAQIPTWAQKSMATALYEGFVNTDAENRINPSLPMTRGDMAFALSRYLDRLEQPR
ncbi:S-layer homology domain-containing protein [Microcoleus sp. FACHB-1515]|uniref:S-layer homology domain-containing protein n=2 Tax=Cyanophyceae TaxID=3028117 RepID=UPI0028C43EB8|nr:S-layer homology domain-containing protein [Microcoleus sp. FACHB-1515]